MSNNPTIDTFTFKWRKPKIQSKRVGKNINHKFTVMGAIAHSDTPKHPWLDGHLTFNGSYVHWDSFFHKIPWIDIPLPKIPGSDFYPKAITDPPNTLVETIPDPISQFGDPIERGILSAQPFVLAMPHHTMAWTQMFGDLNDPVSRKQEYENQMRQLELAKDQLQQQIQQIENYKSKLKEELQKLEEGQKNK